MRPKVRSTLSLNFVSVYITNPGFIRIRHFKQTASNCKKKKKKKKKIINNRYKKMTLMALEPTTVRLEVEHTIH